MPFPRRENYKIKDYADDQIYSVNFSNQTYSVIEDDMAIWGNVSRSGFLNKIFANFKDDAKASISINLQKEQYKIETLFSFLPKESLCDVKKVWLEQLKKELLNKVRLNEKYVGRKFRINNENFRYLTDDASECGENEYYNDCIGRYLKAVFEEYTQKLTHERERIYFLGKFEIIERAIRDKKQLKITIEDGGKAKTFYVRPHSIILSVYHYVIGFSVPFGDGECSEKLKAFRISKINDISLYKSRSGYLTEDEKRKIKKELNEKGTFYLSHEIIEVKIKLTEKGIKDYQSQLHLRPNYVDKTDNNIYRFICTPLQIKYYFLKFGSDAKILEPSSLANEFAEWYKNAYNGYRNE